MMLSYMVSGRGERLDVNRKPNPFESLRQASDERRYALDFVARIDKPLLILLTQKDVRPDDVDVDVEGCRLEDGGVDYFVAGMGTERARHF
jgi:hypothetical protein